MKIARILSIIICSILCLSCSKELVLEGGWDMKENNPITFNFGPKGGSSTVTSLNFKSWEITEITGETISQIITAEVFDDNKIEIKVGKNTNTISVQVTVVSSENPNLIGHIVINQNVKSKNNSLM